MPGGKTVTRNRAWMSAHSIWLRVDQPANRITVRVPLSSPIISREDEVGSDSGGVGLLNGVFSCIRPSVAVEKVKHWVFVSSCYCGLCRVTVATEQ